MILKYLHYCNYNNSNVLYFDILQGRTTKSIPVDISLVKTKSFENMYYLYQSF